MSEKVTAIKSAEDQINPMTLSDAQTGEEYTLEFNRDSVKFAEQQGFDISRVQSAPETNIPILFYASFRMHHKEVSREKTDKMLLEDLGGLLPEEARQLIALYTKSVSTLRSNGDARKNCRLTVKM